MGVKLLYTFNHDGIIFICRFHNLVDKKIKNILSIYSTLITNKMKYVCFKRGHMYIFCVLPMYIIFSSFNQIYRILKLSHFNFTVQWVLTKIHPCDYHQCQNIVPIYHQVKFLQSPLHLFPHSHSRKPLTYHHCLIFFSTWTLCNGNITINDFFFVCLFFSQPNAVF